MKLLPLGFPSHSVDINNEVICIGDICDYDFEGDAPCPFEVVFEHNAFRKKYKGWDETLIKPLLEFGREAKTMRLKIVIKKEVSNTKTIYALFDGGGQGMSDRGLLGVFSTKEECDKIKGTNWYSEKEIEINITKKEYNG